MSLRRPPPPVLALVGNPNTGKTTLFNALTGLNHKTANYAGVTVEKKIGFCRLRRFEETVQILDLPGTYGLLPRSPDEEVVRDVLFGWQKDTPRPDFLVVILDANNLERNLFFALQTLELGLPSLWVLNMWDQAEAKGLSIDTHTLEKETGVRCLKTVGNKAASHKELKRAIEDGLQVRNQISRDNQLRARMSPELACEVLALAEWVGPKTRLVCGPAFLQAEALRLLSDTKLRNAPELHADTVFLDRLREARGRLEAQGIDWSAAEAESRYAYIGALYGNVVAVHADREKTPSDYLDQVLTHPVWGLLTFFAFMLVVFQSIFSWANLPMNFLGGLVERFGTLVERLVPAGAVQSLLVDGIIAGVGNVVVFLPQIFFLFFFIALFEDFGYMARATFVLDRLMKKVGLNGKAFLPLLSSFACAIPGILSTKTIADRNDRLATILVAPLMSCSARLPVYALMIGAFIPASPVLGPLNAKGVALFSMYLLSIVTGLTMAGLFRKSILRGDKTPFLFELPPYRLPNLKTVVLTAWEHARAFLVRAGSIIFMLSIVLWYLLSYPQRPETALRYETMRHEALVRVVDPVERQAELDRLGKLESGEILRSSYAGRLGRLIEPAIQPLGFDWKIGIGLVGSFAAREVLVSTLAIVYNVGGDVSENSIDLLTTLRNELGPSGEPIYSPLVAVSLMVFFVLACQCMSTVAVVRRETGGWRWPLFMIAYMTALAWTGSFLVYQGGRLLGLGG